MTILNLLFYAIFLSILQRSLPWETIHLMHFSCVVSLTIATGIILWDFSETTSIYGKEFFLSYVLVKGLAAFWRRTFVWNLRKFRTKALITRYLMLNELKTIRQRLHVHICFMLRLIFLHQFLVIWTKISFGLSKDPLRNLSSISSKFKRSGEFQVLNSNAFLRLQFVIWF